MIDWSAINTLTNVLRFLKETFRDNDKCQTQESPTQEDNSVPCNQTNPEPYQKGLGLRHKFLREKVLQLNKREMADFYGFEKTSFLEKCEDGDDEFPREAMRRLEEFFFIRRSYIEEGDERIFQTFPLLYTDKGCIALLRQGFRPQILTAPVRSSEQGFCYVVFNKDESGYYRSVVSNVRGNFNSTGGGKGNVINLIVALKECGCLNQYVSISHVRDSDDWIRLENSTFYSRGQYIVAGGADYDSQDIYDKWVEECK